MVMQAGQQVLACLLLQCIVLPWLYCLPLYSKQLLCKGCQLVWTAVLLCAELRFAVTVILPWSTSLPVLGSAASQSSPPPLLHVVVDQSALLSSFGLTISEVVV
jgi:hypothetical protein